MHLKEANFFESYRKGLKTRIESGAKMIVIGHRADEEKNLESENKKIMHTGWYIPAIF